ncbi:4-hydroxy-tetrahydrodipicolinate reductase [uncultured Ruthenibacterium sp.]|uniref:4-hydroxy-tetrahydrodipicolinate reductase n=1 Tax=uncultured Ruthenibacterium sp. TaxID=1905347 RepID=UPI00349E94DF
MLDILLLGCCGKMGTAISQLVAQNHEMSIQAGIDCSQDSRQQMEFPVFTKLGNDIPPADVVIDFSVPELLTDTVEWCCERKIPYVVGTTGISVAQEKVLQRASTLIPIFESANMSLGIYVLTELALVAQKALGEDFDIEIIERHHRGKVDSPSGTALSIAKSLRNADKELFFTYGRKGQKKRAMGEIGIHSVRGGTIAGEHEILFAGADESLTLSHHASSRMVFARGALRAAMWLSHQPPGKYTMKDLIVT